MTAGSEPRISRRPTHLRAVLGLIGLLACVIFSFSSPYFLSIDNLINLLSDLALAGLLALPATFLIMAGQVDLSVGAAAALTGVVLAGTAPDLGLVTAVLLSAGSGLLIGLVNGLLVTHGDVNSIAATFATMAVLRSLAYLVPSGLAIVVPGFRTLGNARPVLGLTLPAVIFLALAVFALLLSRSAAGDRARVIGSLPAGQRLERRRDRRWIVALFAVSGLAAAFVGLIRTSQLGTGLPTAALGVELTVVTAVLLGGGRLSGGRGSILGTSLVLLVISIIDDGLSLTNVTAYAGQVFHALLLLIALVIERPRLRTPRAAAVEAPAPTNEPTASAQT